MNTIVTLRSSITIKVLLKSCFLTPCDWIRIQSKPFLLQWFKYITYRAFTYIFLVCCCTRVSTCMYLVFGRVKNLRKNVTNFRTIFCYWQWKEFSLSIPNGHHGKISIYESYNETRYRHRANITRHMSCDDIIY